MEKESIKSFIPKKAFDIFNTAEIEYTREGCFSNDILETLHSYFDESFIQATELLENSIITCYVTPDSFRKVHDISTKHDKHVVFENTNFCHCNFFKTRVLDCHSSVSCKHVLVVYLARIMGKIQVETVSENVLEEYLNAQLNIFLDLDTQDILL